MSEVIQTAIFGGGCFWCTEAVFQRLKGVESVRPGYSGGESANPTYEQVCSGRSGHVEVGEVRVHPQQISFDELLEVFFATHDPTTLDRQGNDVGPQYQSVIFATSAEQRQAAEAMIERLNASGDAGAPIVTRVRDAEPFWPAESVHVNYYDRNPNQGYCQFVIAPKVAKLKSAFAKRLA